jgi:hypothetical protein
MRNALRCGLPPPPAKQLPRRLPLAREPQRPQARRVRIDCLLLAPVLVPGKLRIFRARFEPLSLLGRGRRGARVAERHCRSAIGVRNVGAHYWLGFSGVGTSDGPITGATLATGVPER